MALFDEKAQKYDPWYETVQGKFVDEVQTKLALPMFPVKQGDYILDAGCGTGNYSLKLAHLGAQVTGIDLSNGMLDIARAKAATFPGQLTFQQMDMSRLDYADETFDGVFSMTAIEFIEDLSTLYDEFERVTKPGGYILLGQITDSGAWGQSYQARKGSIYEQCHFRDLAELEAVRPDRLVASSQGQYFAPDIPEAELNWEDEARRSMTQPASFACVLFQKPLPLRL